MSLQQLIAHPKTFLKQNAVWVSGQLNVACRGRPDTKVWPVTLAPSTTSECKKSDGTVMPCWEIVPATSLGGVTLAYFLPWGPNSTKDMVLGDKANLFLTDTMNGCSFGFGPGGNPRVAHVNYNTFGDSGDREEGKPIDQGHINNEMTRVLGGAPTGALRKQDYVTGTFPNVTVIGVRQGGAWKFVYQKRDYTGSTGKKQYTYKAVHTIR